MANKLRIKKEYIYFILSVGLPIIFFWWLWNLNPVEDFVGRWMAFVDPQRHQHVRQQIFKLSNEQLLKMIHHGDINKASIAASVLSERADEELFEPVAACLTDKSKEVRMSARRILPYIDKEKAGQVLINELDRLDKTTFDYRDTLSILAYMKHSAVYPYLVEYAKNDAGNRHASSVLFEDFGDPSATPVLKEMLTRGPKPDLFEEGRIKKAIQTLEKIAAEKKLEKSPGMENEKKTF